MCTSVWLNILQIVINSDRGRDISIGSPENFADDFHGKLLYMIKLQNGQKEDSRC